MFNPFNYFILFVFLFLYPYAVYPFLIVAISLSFPKKFKNDPLFSPKVTLLISAYNEENEISKKLENSFQLDYPPEKLEIIVASESMDRTNDIASEFIARHQQNIILKAFSGRHGKSYTIYRILPEAKGEIVVFSDANAMYNKDAIKKLISYFADERVGHVSGTLCYKREKESASSDENLYWAYDRNISKAEGKLGLLASANGSIFAIRKNLFNPLTPYRCDDGELPMGVLLKGKLSRYAEDAISYEPITKSNVDEFQRHKRIAGWNVISVAWLLSKALLERRFAAFFVLFSHRFLRWLTPFWLIGIYVTALLSLNSAFLCYVFIFANIFIIMALIGYVCELRKCPKIKIFSIPYYFISIHLAMMFGVLLEMPRILLFKKGSKWEKIR